MLLQARNHLVRFPRSPLVMGIVNINDDSFCNDGSLDAEVSIAQAKQQLLEGADIIDIGAESARTNRGPISIDEEVQRLHGFITRWPAILQQHLMATHHPAMSLESLIAAAEEPTKEGVTLPMMPMLSINTWRPEVIEQILPHGGDIINDISALPDGKNAELCARHGAALLIMHSVGQPKVAHTHVQWPDIMAELEQFFASKIQLAAEKGLAGEHLILDPGIDFAKQRDDNLRIYREMERLHRFERPILLPVSRKTVIGDVLGLPDPTQRDAGTVACVAAGMKRGAQIFRVHHVAAAVQAIKVLHGVSA